MSDEISEGWSPISFFCVGVFLSSLILSTIVNSRAKQGKNSVLIAFYLMLLSLCYIALLVAILFNSNDWFRSILSQFDPVLSIVHVETQFDTACDQRMQKGMKDGVFWFLWNNVEGYVLSHLFGWWLVSVFIIRDASFCFILSLVQELLEIWWERFYAPFRECWWDHCFLDIGCNLIGCSAAFITLKILNLKTPILTSNILKDHRRQFFMAIMIFGECVRFPMMFFTPHVLGIHPKHIFNVTRIFTFKAIVVNLFLNQMYHRLVDRYKTDRYHVRWYRISIVTVALEIAIVLKFQEGKFFDGIYSTPLWKNSSWEKYNLFHSSTPWFPFHVNIWFLYVMIITMFSIDYYLCLQLKTVFGVWIPATEEKVVCLPVTKKKVV